LVAVIGLVAIVNLAVFLPAGEGAVGAVVRVVLGSIFVLFVPGYVLLAALFPERGRSPTDDDRDGLTDDWVSLFDKPREQRTIDGLERAALAFALSIALVPLLVLGLTLAQYAFALVPMTVLLTAWTAALAFALSIALVPLLVLGLTLAQYAFALVPMTVLLTAWTVALALIAAVRRWRLPSRQRFRVPFGDVVAARTQLTAAADSRFEAVLNVGVVAVVLLALATSAYAVAVPPDGERYTEFYVSTENGEGDLSFSDYPERFRPGEAEPITVGIENYEGESVDYSVVVQLQRVAGDANDSTVTRRVPVDRFSTSVGPNETRHVGRNLTVSDRLTGESLRLQFLLYEGPVPDQPTADTAYRSVYLWVDVEGGSGRLPR